MTTIEQVRQEIEEARAREKDLSTRLDDLQGRIEGARSALGEAYAAGADDAETGRLRGEVRAFEDERDGIERGLQVLSEKLATLSDARRETEIENACRARQSTLDRAEAQWRTFFALFSTLAREQLLPQLDEVRDAMAAAKAADARVQKLTGARNLQVGNRYRDTALYWSPMLDRVERMRALVEAAGASVR